MLAAVPAVAASSPVIKLNNLNHFEGAGPTFLPAVSSAAVRVISLLALAAADLL